MGGVAGQDAGVFSAYLKVAVLVDLPILPEIEVLSGDTVPMMSAN